MLMILSATFNIVAAVYNLILGNLQFAVNHTVFALFCINRYDIDKLTKEAKK